MAFDDGVKTVSGSVAHTDDAATKVPFVSVKCGIEPTLTGVSEVTETQTGRNLLDTAISETKTHNSVSITCDGNGKYTASGTATGGSANVTFTLETPCKIKSGMYFHAMNSVANGNASITLQRQDNSTIMYFSLSPTNRIVDLSSYAGETVYSIRFYVVNGASFEMQLTPMVCFSSTAHAYEPYTTPTTYTASLGRTIYGGEVDIVNGVGTENCTNRNLVGEGFTWVLNTTDASFPFFTTGANAPGKASNKNFVCEGYVNRGNYRTFLSDGEIGVFNNTSGINRFCVRDDSCTTLEQFLEKNANTKITYEVTTPTDFTFTPITPTPETVGKVNNVYCNTGNTEVTYYDNAHGFSEVTVNKAGKNLFDISKVATTGTTAGISWSVSGNEITISGTATSSGWKTLVDFKLPHKGTYHFHMNATGNVGYFLRGWTQLVGKDVTEVCNDPSQTYRIAIAVATSGQSYSGTISEIQIEVGDSYTEYEPYEVVSKTAYLHKVIYGGQADVVKGTCEPKNLFDGGNYFPISEEMTNSYYKEFSATTGRMPRIELVVGTTYTFSLDVTSTVEPFTISIGTGDGRYLKDIANKGYNNSGRVSITFTPTTANIDKGAIMAFRVPRYGTTQNFSFSISNVQLEVSPSASDYTPYFEPFSFPPISIGTDEGENTLFANEGDSAITYRKAVD